MMETMGKPDKDLNEVVKHICDVMQKRIDEAYQRGLDAAWEAAKKLSWTEKYGGYGECLDKVFERTDTFDFLEYSPNEAIEKLKAYEEQKADDEIKVGDEVIYIEHRFIVFATETEECYASLFDVNGRHASAPQKDCKKTGRHFDIDKILEEMKE